MFLASFPAGPWQTNCYVVAASEDSPLVVIDPGVQAMPAVQRFAETAGRGVAGVLLTHGHVDHVASAADVADHWGVGVWLHPAERELLTDAGPVLPSAVLAAQFGVVLREPAELHPLVDGESVQVGGLSFDVREAPGHRPGCALLSVDDGEGGTWLFSGDVLFAGSIGRTDLPGGDWAAMESTLRDVVYPLPDEWVVWPGHGPSTTIGAERATNPFLAPYGGIR